jgi:hypothetical protein
MKRTLTLLATSLVAFLVSAVTALAGTVSNPSSQGGAVQDQLDHGGGLPFTGFNLVILIVGAAILIAAGLALRRTARSR